jgi:hypothetical protein
MAPGGARKVRRLRRFSMPGLPLGADGQQMTPGSILNIWSVCPCLAECARAKHVRPVLNLDVGRVLMPRRLRKISQAHASSSLTPLMAKNLRTLGF